MTVPPQPGLRHQSATRIVLRVLGAVLLLAGLFLVVTGGKAFLAEMDEPSMDSGFGPILRLGGGGIVCVLGLALLNMGFLGSQSRYVAGETMPTLRDSASYVRGQGAGPTGDRAATATGPFCRSCGTRNDQDARFCDSCGASLA